MGQHRLALRLPRLALSAEDRGRPVPLERSSFLRLRASRRGTNIRCSKGMLWLTRAGDPLDHLLGAGEGLTISQPGLVLVQALGDSAVQLTPADLG